MTDLDYEKLINELLTNKRISQQIKTLNLSWEQIIEALPILLDMQEQDLNFNEESLYLTSFYVTPSGAVKRMETLSPLGQKKAYLNNLVTRNIYLLNFDDHKRMKTSQERTAIIDWVANFLKNLKHQKQGLFLCGETGVGKTFILKKIAKSLAQRNHKIGYVLLPDLVNYLKKTFNNYEEYENVKQLLKNVPYLFIDDIGSETISSWFRDEFLWIILNHRLENERVTFFASNYNLDELLKVESRTQNQTYRDIEKAKRLISKIKLLSVSLSLKG